MVRIVVQDDNYDMMDVTGMIYDYYAINISSGGYNVVNGSSIMSVILS